MHELTASEHGTASDPLMAALQRGAVILLGPDRRTRGHSGIILLCVLMYAICCAAATHAASIGMMLPIGPTLLIAATFPAYFVFYVLIRSGYTRNWRDSGLTPQLELFRFAVMVGSLPVLIFTADLISRWQQRLSSQRQELQDALAQVQQLATRDALTGLYNRHHMQDKLDYASQRYQRYGERFTLALIDLDHFKRINDGYGHQVGDQALMAFATAASMVLRDTDTLARWGGEEFLFLMPNTSPQKAAIALDRIRETLQTVVISAVASHLKLQFSAGLALHIGGESPEGTLERADQALYQAKNEGRHRSVVAAGREAIA